MPYLSRASLQLMVWVATILAVRAASAQSDDAEALPRGHSSIVFPQKHPLSDLRDQARRMGVPLKNLRERHPTGGEYRIEDESFQLFVPDRDPPETGFGLFVWISPTASGRTRADWYPVLAERALVAIGANQSGNDRHVLDRSSLALDAVHNLQMRIPIDEQRVYVGGFSGGGRMASRLCTHYPEVFHAGLYVGACNFYEAIPVPEDESRIWPAGFKKPTGNRLRAVKKDVRHVHLIGSEDYNFVQSLRIFERMRDAEKFAHVTFLEVPGLDHSVADASWLEKAFDAMDGPLAERRAKQEELARKRGERAAKKAADQDDRERTETTTRGRTRLTREQRGPVPGSAQVSAEEVADDRQRLGIGVDGEPAP